MCVPFESADAVEKNQRAHRVASGVVFAFWIGLSFHTHGLGAALKTALHYSLPLACIWHPTALASYTGFLGGINRFVQQPSHPVFLRWAAWFLLLIVPLILIAVFSQNA